MMWKEHYLLNPQFVWVGEEKTEGAEMVKEMGWRETEVDMDFISWKMVEK